LAQPALSRADLRKDAKAGETFYKMAYAAPFLADVVRPTEGKAKAAEVEEVRGVKAAAPFSEMVSAAKADLKLGLGTAFIGGGCCVHLSIEYTPSTPTAVSAVAVLVQDSEGTAMLWFKTEKAGAGYQIKEGVITTKPGAHLTVVVVNMTARVRWCEIFSC
jgi:hypothetical protein